MSWSWRYCDPDGAELSVGELAQPLFPTQSDAETWIGEEWPTLLAGGVSAVVLLEEQREVYGPMSLLPPD
jgi:hypothetical protein